MKKFRWVLPIFCFFVCIMLFPIASYATDTSQSVDSQNQLTTDTEQSVQDVETQNEQIENIEAVQATDINENPDDYKQMQETNGSLEATTYILDISSLVVTWSGVILTFITLLSVLLAFIGIHEIRDISKIHKEVSDLESKMKADVERVESLRQLSEEQLEVLTEHFKNNAQTIMMATYYFSLGSNSYDEAKYRDAIMYLKKSLKYLPQSTDSLCLIGRAYTIVGEKVTSDEYFRKALEIDNNCAAAYRGLAAWHRHTNPEEALKNAKLAVEKEPENVEMLNYLGLLLRDQNYLSESLQKHLEANAIKRNPDTDFFLSLLYAKENSLGRARFHINNAIDQYENVDEFEKSKPVWKELAKWASILISECQDETTEEKALSQLDIIKQSIDTERTKIVVTGHVKFLLEGIKKDEKYISHSLGRISDETK